MKNLENFLEVEKALMRIMGGRKEEEVVFFLQDRYLEPEEVAGFKVGEQFVDCEPWGLAKRFNMLEAVETLYRDFLYAPKFGVTGKEDGDDYVAILVVDAESREILGKVEKKDFNFTKEQPCLKFTEVVETVIEAGILPLD